MGEGSFGPGSVVGNMALPAGLLNPVGTDVTGLALIRRADLLFLVALGAARHREYALLLGQIVIGYHGAVAASAGDIGRAVNESLAGFVAGLTPRLDLFDGRAGHRLRFESPGMNDLLVAIGTPLSFMLAMGNPEGGLVDDFGSRFARVALQATGIANAGVEWALLTGRLNRQVLGGVRL